MRAVSITELITKMVRLCGYIIIIYLKFVPHRWIDCSPSLFIPFPFVESNRQNIDESVRIESFEISA